MQASLGPTSRLRQVSEIVAALRSLRPSACGTTLRRWAYQLRRTEMQPKMEATQRFLTVLNGVEAPLLLYVDATVAQLPLEACPCLRWGQGS